MRFSSGGSPGTTRVFHQHLLPGAQPRGGRGLRAGPAASAPGGGRGLGGLGKEPPNALADTLHRKLGCLWFQTCLLALGAHARHLTPLLSGCLEGLGWHFCVCSGLFSWLMSSCSLAWFLWAIKLLLLEHSRPVGRMWQRWRVGAGSSRKMLLHKEQEQAPRRVSYTPQRAGAGRGHSRPSRAPVRR